MTFRINESVVDELQIEADQREISLNTLINQILRRYSDWDRFETKMGMMPVPKQMLSALVDRAISVGKQNGIKDIQPYREQIAKEAARTALAVMKDSVLFMKKEYNIWTVLAVLQEYMKVSGINTDHKIEPGRKHVFLIQHDLGENWSEFTMQLIRMIFEELAQVRASVSATPNTVIAEVLL